MTLDLSRPRELGALFSDSLRLYFAHFGRFLAIGAAVVIPTEVVVSGVGLHELSGGYTTTRPEGANAVGVAVQGLVTAPLIVAMTMYLVLDLAEGRGPSLRRAIQSGLDAFTPLFLPVLAAVAGEVLLTLAVVAPIVASGSSALVPLMLLPLILIVRWFFVAQSVVAGGARGLAALRASWELTRGFGWRVFGTVAAAFLAFNLVTSVAVSPIATAAKSADSGALLFAAQTLGETVAAPALALVSALLYFDLRARRGIEIDRLG